MANPHEKLDPKSRGLACQTAMDVAAEIVNRICGSEGSRVVKITKDRASVSFAVPPEVVEKAEKPGLTREERITAIAESEWARGWAEGMMDLVAPELKGAERERAIRRLARRVAEEVVG